MLLIEKLVEYIKLDAKRYLALLREREGKAIHDKEKKLIQAQRSSFLQRNQELVTILNDNDGLCLGLSICHGVMHCFGKLDWWEKGLAALEDWDGTKEQLESKMELPNGEPITYEKFFERALNYILFSQVATRKGKKSLHLMDDYLPGELKQIHYLKHVEADAHSIQIPAGKNVEKKEIKRSYLEFVVDGKIATIQSSDVVAGNFSKNDLSMIFNNISSRELCLVSSQQNPHTIQVGFNKNTGEWMVYDPNLQKNDTFQHKNDFLDFLQRRLPGSLNVYAGTFELGYTVALIPLHYFRYQLMENDGFTTMVEHTPKRLLEYLFDLVFPEDEALKVIAEGMRKKNYSGSTNLSTLLNISLEMKTDNSLVDKLIGWAEMPPYMESVWNDLASALQCPEEPTAIYGTMWGKIAMEHFDNFATIVRIAKKNQELQTSLANSLNIYLLHFITRKDKQIIFDLIELNEVRKKLFQEPMIKKVYEYMIYGTKEIPYARLLEFAKENDALKNLIAKGLNSDPRWNRMSLSAIAKEKPECLSQLLALADTSPSGQNIRKALINAIESNDIISAKQEVKAFVEQVKQFPNPEAKADLSTTAFLHTKGIPPTSVAIENTPTQAPEVTQSESSSPVEPKTPQENESNTEIRPGAK